MSCSRAYEYAGYHPDGHYFCSSCSNHTFFCHHQHARGRHQVKCMQGSNARQCSHHCRSKKGCCMPVAHLGRYHSARTRSSHNGVQCALLYAVPVGAKPVVLLVHSSAGLIVQVAWGDNLYCSHNSSGYHTALGRPGYPLWQVGRHDWWLHCMHVYMCVYACMQLRASTMTAQVATSAVNLHSGSLPASCAAHMGHETTAGCPTAMISPLLARTGPLPSAVPSQSMQSNSACSLMVVLSRYTPGSPAAARALQAMRQGWSALKRLPKLDQAALAVTGGVLVPFSAPEATSRQACSALCHWHQALEQICQVSMPWYWACPCQLAL